MGPLSAERQDFRGSVNFQICFYFLAVIAIRFVSKVIISGAQIDSPRPYLLVALLMLDAFYILPCRFEFWDHSLTIVMKGLVTETPTPPVE